MLASLKNLQEKKLVKKESMNENEWVKGLNIHHLRIRYSEHNLDPIVYFS